MLGMSSLDLTHITLPGFADNRMDTQPSGITPWLSSQIFHETLLNT